MGPGIRKMEIDGTWGPCKKPIRERGPTLKITRKFARVDSVLPAAEILGPRGGSSVRMVQGRCCRLALDASQMSDQASQMSQGWS
jgi:hypothetical protein